MHAPARESCLWIWTIITPCDHNDDHHHKNQSGESNFDLFFLPFKFSSRKMDHPYETGEKVCYRLPGDSKHYPLFLLAYVDFGIHHSNICVARKPSAYWSYQSSLYQSSAESPEGNY